MSSGQNLSIFVPVTKIDAEKRLVYGTVAAEVLDNSGEMFDYEASKPYFQKWSDNAYATSGGKSKGNLRVMHTSKVAGVLTDLGFNDDARVIECCAKVVDDSEWKMVEAGAYTGFSMGGRYVSRATKSDGVKTYVADPVEVSLVDKPCIPTATFEVIKADGIEQRRFAEHLYTEKYDRYDYRGQDGKFSTKPTKDAATHGGSDPTGHGKNNANADADTLIPPGAAISLSPQEAVALFSKSDTGENQMKVPTNDEMLPVAKALAKAATGSEDSWLQYMDAARDQLSKGDTPDSVKDKIDAKAEKSEDEMSDEEKAEMEKSNHKDDHMAEKKDNPFAKDKDGDEDGMSEDEMSDEEKAKMADMSDEDKAKMMAEKADVATGVSQVWKTSDGNTFAKKADAVAHEGGLTKSSHIPGLADELRKTVENAKKIGVEESAVTVTKSDIESTIGEPLARFRSFLDDNLVKGMYTVESLSRIVSSLDYLHSSLCCERAWEGDSTSIPEQVMTGLMSMGKVLVELAEHEVREIGMRAGKRGNNAGMTAASPEVMALAATTLGLEKSDFESQVEDILRKADQIDQPVAKVDDSVLQKMESLEEENRLMKADLEEVKPLIKTLQDEITRISALAMPKAPTTSAVAVSKSEDGAPLSGHQTTDLEKLDPSQLADFAIRMAQQHGRSMVIPSGVR